MDRPESRSRAKSRAKASRNVALRSSWQLVTQHRSSYRQQELGQVVRTKNEILRKKDCVVLANYIRVAMNCSYNYVPRFQTDVFVCPMWSPQCRFVGFVGGFVGFVGGFVGRIIHRSRTCSGAPHLLPVDWPFTGRPQSPQGRLHKTEGGF